MTTRAPRFAGRYYFPDAGRLRAAVESFIEDANFPQPRGTLVGLIAPHSTLNEFGPIAGYAYKMLLTAPLSWDKTLLLAPTAHASTANALVCDATEAYDTLLEPMPIDRATLTLAQQAGVPIEDAPDDEPVIECALPFVQAALGQVTVLPLRVPVLLDVAQVAPLAQHIELIIACANLPADHVQAACNAIARLDASFFDGALGNEKRGRFSRQQSKPASSANNTTLALALTLARARGATHAHLLKRAGAFAAFALLRL